LGISRCLTIKTGLKVFMDAHKPVTLEEGDRYPLGPPNIWGIDVMVAWDLCKVFARVRFSYPPQSFVRVLARESHAV